MQKKETLKKPLSLKITLTAGELSKTSGLSICLVFGAMRLEPVHQVVDLVSNVRGEGVF